MSYARDKRDKVRRLYVVDRQPLKAAASLSKVSYSAAQAWKKRDKLLGNDWDHARMAHQLNEHGPASLVSILINDVAPFIRSTMEHLKGNTKDKDVQPLTLVQKIECISRLSDAMQKITKVAGLVDPKLAKLSIGLAMMKKLAEFTAERFPQHQAALVEILEPFGEELAHEAG